MLHVQEVKATSHTFNPHPPAEQSVGIAARVEPPPPTLITLEDKPGAVPQEQPTFVMG
jgi:hypothetical protein